MWERDYSQKRAEKYGGSLDSEEARAYCPGITLFQVGNWRRNVGAAADQREFERTTKFHAARHGFRNLGSLESCTVFRSRSFARKRRAPQEQRLVCVLAEDNGRLFR
jgi:hypothetical protein